MEKLLPNGKYAQSNFVNSNDQSFLFQDHYTQVASIWT